MHFCSGSGTYKKCVLLILIFFIFINTLCANEAEFIINIPQSESIETTNISLNWLDRNGLFNVSSNSDIFIVNSVKKKILRKF